MSNSASDMAASAAAPVFAALGDATRLALVARLCDGQTRSIAQLTHGTGLTRQGVTKHLSVLEHARIVSCHRVGRESKFTIRPDSLSEARQFLDRASQQWDDAILRLRMLVEE